MSLRKIENPDIFRANIRAKLAGKLNDEKAALNLEKGIYNYTLKEADRCKIIKKWDNKFFVEIYVSHLRSILNNLNDQKIIATYPDLNLLLDRLTKASQDQQQQLEVNSLAFELRP